MARKKGLPFVVQPRLEPIMDRVGTEESGIIEIQRKGYLTVAEKSITQGGLQGDTSVRKLFALSGRIARESGQEQAKVSQDIINPERPDYLAPYEEEISDAIMEMVAFQERSTIIQATALLMCRVDTNWTVDQTMELHPDLVADLALLYHDEEKQTTDALEAATEEGRSKGAVQGKE